MYAASPELDITTLRYDPKQGAMVAGTPIVTGYVISNLIEGDFNGDGQADLAGYDRDAQKVFVLFGPDFTQAVDTPVQAIPQGLLAVGDFEGDQKQELVFASPQAQLGGKWQLNTFAYRNGRLLVAAPTLFDNLSPNNFPGVQLAVSAQPGQGSKDDLVMGNGENLLVFQPTGDLDPAKPAFVVVPPSPGAADSVIAVALGNLNGDDRLAPVTLDLFGKLSTWYDVTGGVQLTGLRAGTQAGGYNIGVHLAGSEAILIQGTVFHDLNNSGQWNPKDPGLGLGVRVYVDLNHNGRLDAGEPSRQPSLEGAYSFGQLPPGTYQLRLALGADDFSPTSMRQTFPANGEPVTVTVDAAGGVSYGADFGVYINPTSNDFNNDGYPDLVLVDRSTNALYVQLRHPAAQGPLATYLIGTLPGPQWRVAGVGDFNSDGWQDILLQNTQTGRLKLWEMTGGERPSLNQALDLAATVPAGWDLAAVADYDGNGTPDLLLQDETTGAVAVWYMEDLLVINRADLPPEDVRGALVGVGDLNGDGTQDLLWQEKDGSLVATLLDRDGSLRADAVVGRLPAGWEVADVMNLTGGASDDIILQDPTTGAVRLWRLGAQAGLLEERPLDIGPHNGAVTVELAQVVRIPDHLPGGQVAPDQPLSASGQVLTMTEAVPFRGVVASFTDADDASQPNDYSAAIDWNDGTPTTSGTIIRDPRGGFDIIGDHTYAHAGRYSIAVVITDLDKTHDSGGSTATAVSAVSVTAPPVAPPVVVPSPPVVVLPQPVAPPVAVRSGFGPGRDAFVTTLYRELLGRGPEPKGLRYWSGRLASGTGSWEVAQELWRSRERRTLVGRGLAPHIGLRQSYADALRIGKLAARPPLHALFPVTRRPAHRATVVRPGFEAGRLLNIHISHP